MLTQLEKQTSSSGSSAILENLQPVDQERFEAYNQSQQLTDKLDSLETSLSSVITEINTLTRDNYDIKESDPIAQIIKILNAHLASLQYIDESADDLHRKLLEAEAQSSRLRI